MSLSFTSMGDIFTSKLRLDGVPHRNATNFERCSTAPALGPQLSFDSSLRASRERRRRRRSQERHRHRASTAAPPGVGQRVAELQRVEVMELAMRRNQLMRRSMGMPERGYSSVARREAEEARCREAELEEGRRLAAERKKALNLDSGYTPIKPLPELGQLSAPQPRVPGKPDGDLGWGRCVPAKVLADGGERPPSRAQDFEGTDTARRHFFETYANHREEMIDPRFELQPELSGRWRRDRVTYVEEHYTARHRFMEECQHRKANPLPVLLAPQSRPAPPPDSGGGGGVSGGDGEPGGDRSPRGVHGGVVDLTNYRLGDNLAGALVEALRLRPGPVTALLLADNSVCGLPGELQSASGGLNTSGILDQQPRRPRHLGAGELRREKTPAGLRPSITALCELLRQHEHTLDRLDLSLNPIGWTGASLLADALHGNTVLQELKLRQCMIKDRGMSMLAGGLCDMTALRLLDLRDNGLGQPSGEAIARVVKFSVGLEELQFGWNPLRSGGERVLRSLMHNDGGIHTVGMQWTGLRDPDGGAIAHALHHAQELQLLDVSHNEIGEKAAQVIAGALKRTRTLRELRLCGNPIGKRGSRAMFKMLRVLKPDEWPSVDLTGCNMGDIDRSPLFDFTNPAGKYMEKTSLCGKDCDAACQAKHIGELHLEDPYDAMVAYELIELAWNEEGENIANEQLDGVPFDVEEPEGFKDGRVVDYYRLPDEYAVNGETGEPVCHRLAVEYLSTRVRPQMEDKANDRQWAQLRELMHGSGPVGAQHALEAACGVCFFSVEQATELVLLVRMLGGNRVLAIVPLLSRLVDPIKLIELFAILTNEELKSLKSRVGDDLFHFNPRNPTGHYQLDLSTKYDWVVAQSLVDCANEERMHLLREGILPQVDFSQHQDGELWRNATRTFFARDAETGQMVKQVEPLRFNSKFKLPNSGMLDVDFTSTNRPSGRAKPIAEHVLANLITGMAEAFNRAINVHEDFAAVASPEEDLAAKKARQKGRMGPKKKGGGKKKKGKKGKKAKADEAAVQANGDASSAAAGAERPVTPNTLGKLQQMDESRERVLTPSNEEKRSAGKWLPTWRMNTMADKELTNVFDVAHHAKHNLDAEVADLTARVAELIATKDGLDDAKMAEVMKGNIKEGNQFMVRIKQVEEELAEVQKRLLKTRSKQAIRAHRSREVDKSALMGVHERPVWHVPLDQQYQVYSEEKRREVGSERACEVLRRATFVFYFTAAQAERIVQWFPPGYRVEPLVVLFCRVIDLEHLYRCYYHLSQPSAQPPPEAMSNIKLFKPCVAAEFPIEQSEFHVLMTRLGALNVFSPYNLNFRWELNLERKDERKVISMLVNLERNEDGENWLDESRDWLKFDVNQAWLTDEGMPDTGIVRITYNTEPHCADGKRRSGLAHLTAVGRGKQSCIPDVLNMKYKGRMGPDGQALREPDEQDSEDEGFELFAAKVKVKKVDKKAWKTIDMSDFVINNHKLRNSMRAAMEDGDVDKGELREIVSTLLRAGHPKTTIDAVKAALGDGDMDDEDRALLHSLIPPDPHADWTKALVLLETERGFLSSTFRYYVIHGGGAGDSEEMGKMQFVSFAKAVRLTGKKEAGLLPTNQVESIFMRANLDRAPPGVNYYEDAKLEEAVAAIAAMPNPKADTIMELKEFVAGIIRLASARYPTISSFTTRLERLFEEHLQPYALGSQEDDVIALLLREPEVQATLMYCREVLRPLFEFYCTADKSVVSRSHATTMNMPCFLRFLEEAALFDAKLTMREAKIMFVDVNLDDEMDETTAGGDAGTELELEEFEELVCRVAWEKRGDEVEPSRGEGGGTPFEQMLEDFVDSSLAALMAKKQLHRRLKTPEEKARAATIVIRPKTPKTPTTPAGNPGIGPL